MRWHIGVGLMYIVAVITGITGYFTDNSTLHYMAYGFSAFVNACIFVEIMSKIFWFERGRFFDDKMNKVDLFLSCLCWLTCILSILSLVLKWNDLDLDINLGLLVVRFFYSSPLGIQESKKGSGNV